MEPPLSYHRHEWISLAKTQRQRQMLSMHAFILLEITEKKIRKFPEQVLLAISR